MPNRRPIEATPTKTVTAQFRLRGSSIKTKQRVFSMSGLEPWRVGANGALALRSSDIPCDVCGIVQKIFVHGLLANRLTPKGRDRELTRALTRLVLR